MARRASRYWIKNWINPDTLAFHPFCMRIAWNTWEEVSDWLDGERAGTYLMYRYGSEDGRGDQGDYCCLALSDPETAFEAKIRWAA